VFGKRQRHGVALLELRNARRGARACEGKLALRRIDALNFNRCAALDDQFSEGAVAAADVDPPQAWRRRQPIEKNIARQSAPDSHHPLVSGPIVEADLEFGHRLPREQDDAGTFSASSSR
jgi:hypothetical protein